MPKAARFSIAPVRSLALEHPDTIDITEVGVVEDRRFFLADHTNRLIDRLVVGELVQIQTHTDPGGTRLRIEAVDRAITLKQIRVKFASGPDEVFAMHERVDPGKPYGPLEFKTGKAPIKTIEALYRSRFDLQKGLKSALNGRPAVVQIWGQH